MLQILLMYKGHMMEKTPKVNNNTRSQFLGSQLILVACSQTGILPYFSCKKTAHNINPYYMFYLVWMDKFWKLASIYIYLFLI